MKSLHKKLLLLLDVILVSFTILVFSLVYTFAYNFIIDLTNPHYYYAYLTLLILIIVCFYINQQYKYNIVLNIIPHTFAIAKSMLMSFVALIFIAFIFNAEEILINRYYWISLFVYILISFLFIRVLLVPYVYNLLIKRGIVRRNVLIIGGGNLGRKIIRLIRNNTNYYNIIGIIDNDPLKQSTFIEEIPLLGKEDRLNEIIVEKGVSDIFVAINKISHDQLAQIIDKCKQYKRTIHVVSTHYNNVIDRCEIEEIGGSTFFRITQPSSVNYYKVFKRFMDVSLSFLLILILLPFLILIAVIIKLTSKGPVFYKAYVVGKDGIPFTWYKFRSMVLNNEQEHIKLVKEVINSDKKAVKLKNDSRITHIGKFIRKFGVDEVPQLFNVLKGEMSLVGPRPKLQYEYELMENWQKARFSVIPGITGLYQIKGKNDVAFKDEIVIDLYYIENRTIKLDLEIAVKTIPFLLFGNNR